MHPGSHSLHDSYEAAVEAGGKHKLLRPGTFPPAVDSDVSRALPRCVRVLPHHNDTSGFFIAVFDKVREVSAPAGGCGYDSGEDEDGEEAHRRDQLHRLE